MVNFTLSLDDEKYEKIKDMAFELNVNKQEVIRRLVQFGFAWIAQEQLKKELKE